MKIDGRMTKTQNTCQVGVFLVMRKRCLQWPGAAWALVGSEATPRRGLGALPPRKGLQGKEKGREKRGGESERRGEKEKGREQERVEMEGERGRKGESRKGLKWKGREQRKRGEREKEGSGREREGEDRRKERVPLMLLSCGGNESSYLLLAWACLEDAQNGSKIEWSNTHSNYKHLTHCLWSAP